MGLGEEILSGCCLHFTGKKKKKIKTAQGLSWFCFHTSQREAGWARRREGKRGNGSRVRTFVLELCCKRAPLFMGFARALGHHPRAAALQSPVPAPERGKDEGFLPKPPSSCRPWVFIPGWSLSRDPGPWPFSWDVQPKPQNLQRSLEGPWSRDWGAEPGRDASTLLLGGGCGAAHLLLLHPLVHPCCRFSIIPSSL